MVLCKLLDVSATSADKEDCINCIVNVSLVQQVQALNKPNFYIFIFKLCWNWKKMADVWIQ